MLGTLINQPFSPVYFLCIPWRAFLCVMSRLLTQSRQVSKSSADWADSMQSLAEFSTVEDFWKVYNNVPKPSQVSEPGSSSRWRRISLLN